MKNFFEETYRKQYFSLLNEVFDSGFLSEGQAQRQFETLFSESVNMPCAAVSSGGAALTAMYEYAEVQGGEVVVPANTFWATAVAAKRLGADVVYADCNREDLCLSFEDLKRKTTPKTKAVCVTHIGGHIAFQIEEIAAFCAENNIVLLEDCAHAHGATWNGKSAGSWGLGGAYSFYATKTMPLGEGGMVVSKDSKFIDWMKHYRNYGKKVVDGNVSYELDNGFNFRMNEVTAAFGVVQMSRLPVVLEWKRRLAKKFDRIFENRVKFPTGMESGYYKYIVFDYELTEQTGKVFNSSDFGNVIEGKKMDLPNSEWIAEHHQCPPIWYGWDGADLGVEQLKTRLGIHGD